MNEEFAQSTEYQSSNRMALQDQSFMERRLDNSPLIERVENFLSARRKTVSQSKDGEFKESYTTLGSPLANPEGINQILHIISMRTDPHAVQGNFDKDHYYSFIERTRKELAEQIISNLYEWGINENRQGVIIDTIMGFIEPYMSRVIDNKERESYMNQFKSSEVITQPKGGLFNFTRGVGRE